MVDPSSLQAHADPTPPNTLLLFPSSKPSTHAAIFFTFFWKWGEGEKWYRGGLLQHSNFVSLLPWKMKSKQSGSCSSSGVGKGMGITAAYPDATVISGGTLVNVCNKQLPQQPKEYTSTKQKQRHSREAETACGNGHCYVVNNTSAMNKISGLVSRL